MAIIFHIKVVVMFPYFKNKAQSPKRFGIRVSQTYTDYNDKNNLEHVKYGV
jgi:hypothetical protein